MDERTILRDKFAMAALTGFLAEGSSNKFLEADIAGAAYRMAEAMLDERDKFQEKE